LTARQAKEVEHSWATFRSQTLGRIPVRSWNLVMPWEPTNERLDWLAAMVSDTGPGSEWLGRVRLDGLASKHPKLVDSPRFPYTPQIHRGPQRGEPDIDRDPVGVE
jgi:hypothetical protein